ncbi:MAG: protein kinase domain-containing protein [Candidatus Sulfotelmatobacter sp.]
MIGRTLSHYRINAALGAGGMGEVYRATDTKLGRDVALKVLPPDVASDPERLARFQREARAVAALNHPNVVTLYSVEESDGVHFLTMELIEGQSLDRMISSNGLPADRVIEIASAMAEALSAAHEKGIVHRDLKPANVMVTNEGRVKVLDFGLAKDVGAETSNDATLTSAGHTQAGVVMGTPAYMSPEQVSGRALDHRTDIFSLGVLLYEMAAGHRPFEGSSSAELVSSILRDSPPSIADVRPELPPDLSRIIRRCLEKDPRYRVQTARDVSNEFRDLARNSTRATPVSTSTARSTATRGSGETRTEEGFWVAVLPLKYSGGNAALTALTEGLSEEIVTGLSRFSYLRVIAHGSTLRYANQAADLRTVGRELGARYVMEGSLRQAGTRLRLAVQLVDASSGAHLWAETYDRPFNADAIFELQDDLVPRIVSTVADQYGILPRSMSEALRSKSEDTLTPHEAVLRAFSYFERITPDEHATLRRILEHAVQEAPEQADCWAMLSMIYRGEYAQGFNARPDPLGRALATARRAAEAAPSNHLSYYALATTYFFRKDKFAFRTAADRCIALNRMDGSTVAYLGYLMAVGGDWEHGNALVESAKQLNPNHPGWYHVAAFAEAYRKGKYAEALEATSRVNTPGYFHAQAARAAALGQLGQREAAQKALQELLALRPDFAAAARQEYGKWYDSEEVEHLIDGLRKAGLDILGENSSASMVPAPSASVQVPTSGAARAAPREGEGFWVAVLPFRGAGGDADLEALADGLSEDVTTGLARFPYLQVIAHNSAMAYKGLATDIRTVGRELGARYVLEGSIRKRGSSIRVSAQLMDAVSGTQLWAEAYDREIHDRQTHDRENNNDAGTFQIQDDLTDHIVTAVADGYGVLVRSMAAPTRDRKVEELSASELVLRYYAFMQQVDPQEHAALRAGFERVLEREPNHATAWACLSNLYVLEYGDGFNPREKPMERAREAAWRAVKIDPACQMGWKLLAVVHFFSRDFATFRETAERAMALNPRDGTTLAYVGILMAYSGDWERGVAMVQRARDLNRHHPGWYYNASFAHHYRKGEYEAALLAAKKINMPEYHWMHLAIAACCGMLGHHEEARAAIESLRKYNPTFLDLENVRDELARWDPDEDEVERFMQGLQKAGLKYGTGDSPAMEAEPKPKPKSDPAAARGEAANSGSMRVGRKDSGAARAAVREDEGFWVAVLPFKCPGNNADILALADGLNDDIITGLSRFSYLRVIARSSTARYAQQAIDVRAAAGELGARYVMEGSIRQAGAKVRIAVQLVDANSGTSLWAETYDRPFTPDVTLDLLDDVVPRIVATVADTQGVLPHSMTETLRNRDPESFTPYEALLRSFGFHQHVNAAEQLAGRTALERAVKQVPDCADYWAMLSWLYRSEYSHGHNTLPDPMDRSLAAARRAVDLAPSSQFPHAALASAFFFRRELDSFRTAADRALPLNRMEGYITAFLGMLLAFSGDWQRGCAQVERSTELNPNHPGWYWVALALNAYRQKDGQRALEYALKINMPGLWLAQITLTLAYIQLGNTDRAQAALRDLLAARPDFRTNLREELGKWWQPDMIEQMVGDLRAAGLEVDAEQKSEPGKPADS